MFNECNDSHRKKHAINFFSLNSFDESLNSLRFRSNSCMIPSITDLAYCLDFVPKLRPKKHNGLPSPMNLNAKGFRHLKKNKVSKIMLETNNYYLSCPEQDDIDSDSTEGESSKFFESHSRKDYEKKYSIRKDTNQNKFENLGMRFSSESEHNYNNNSSQNRNSNEIPCLDLTNQTSKNSIGNPSGNNINFAFARKKSRVMPEEIKINPKDLKGFAMEFESIYDYFDRDPQNFETQTAFNFEKIGSSENRTFVSRKSLIHPFSPAKKNSSVSNGNDSFKKGSGSVFSPVSGDGDYQNLKDNSNNTNNGENDYFLKGRANSILRILENNLEKKTSIDFYEK